MAKHMWQVEAGADHPDYEGRPASTHVYESPKDAMKVAKRYVQKRSVEEGVDGPVQSMNVRKNTRVFAPRDGESTGYATVSPAKIRSKDFAFRRD